MELCRKAHGGIIVVYGDQLYGSLWISSQSVVGKSRQHGFCLLRASISRVCDAFMVLSAVLSRLAKRPETAPRSSLLCSRFYDIVGIYLGYICGSLFLSVYTVKSVFTVT